MSDMAKGLNLWKNITIGEKHFNFDRNSKRHRKSYRAKNSHHLSIVIKRQ